MSVRQQDELVNNLSDDWHFLEARKKLYQHNLSAKDLIKSKQRRIEGWYRYLVTRTR